MKILTACHAGICRSAAMANELKRYGHDVLVAGVGYNSPETIKMLADWAEKIVVLQKELVQLVPLESRPKVVLADIGPDVWTSSADQDLRNRVKVIVDAWRDGEWNLDSFTLRPRKKRPSRVS